MKCRFTPTHGDFPNPVALRQHYDAQHPEYVSGNEGRVKCSFPGCYSYVRPENLDKHMKNQHGEKGKELVVHPKKVQPAPVPWHADQIVLPVVAELIGKSVPLEKLPTVFKWRDATAEMLDELQ